MKEKILTIVLGLIIFLVALWCSGEPDENAPSSAIIISNVITIALCALSVLLVAKLNPEDPNNEL